MLHLRWLQGSTRIQIGVASRDADRGNAMPLRYSPSTHKTWVSGIVLIFGARFPDLRSHYAATKTS